MSKHQDYIKSFDRFKRLGKRHYAWAKLGKRLGKKIAWVTSGAPSELLLPFGIYPVYPQSHAALCAARHMSTAMMEAAELRGYSSDLCSYGRSDLGSVFSGLSPIGGLPRPDILLCCTNICGTVLKWYQALAQLYKVPLVLIDTPFLNDQNNAPAGTVPEASIKYVERQMEEAPLPVPGFTKNCWQKCKCGQKKELDE